MQEAVYKLCVKKIQEYIRSHPAHNEGCIDAFAFSTVLAILFDKSRTETMEDLIEIGGI